MNDDSSGQPNVEHGPTKPAKQQARVTGSTWAEQVGPSLTEADTARLLDRDVCAVADDPGLLRLRTDNGRLVYPFFQFHDGHQIDGIADVVRILPPVLCPTTIASWLTHRQPFTGGRRPLDALIDGDRTLVLDAAADLASTAAG
ncbi:hypothetical protein [Cellulomonas massiliensis]|uniref:hypothetical protein n=1 Tax=Cellulomonas massiliensis TaxID=1465811 RepID=UPI00035D6A6C|nr:hypothetical protein [Cellulomonas massiliensis]